MQLDIKNPDNVLTPIILEQWEELKQTIIKSRIPHQALYKVMPVVTVNLNSRMRTTAGRAFLKYNKIDMNVRLLSLNLEEVRETFAHELAHLITHHLYGRVQSHGKHWCSVMRALGYAATRTHSLDTAAFKAKTKKYETTCGCEGRVHMIGPRRYNKIINEVTTYRCLTCKQNIKPTGVMK